jgi:2-(1,2-epoxy-1,2-dihydrophenyl)acetyl-CoA isomerase
MTASEGSKVEVELTRTDAVLTITLNRPEVLNAFNQAMHEQLAAALDEALDPALRAIVITGAGRGFCVGQDVSEFPRDPEQIAELLRRRYNPIVLAIRALEKPVIAAVNGAAAGAGLALAMACDVRIAAESASFVPAFIGIGLVPDSGLSHTLPRLLGPSAAFEWLISGDKLTAAQARDRGIVSAVVAADQLAAEAATLAAMLAAKPTRAIALTKRLLEHSPGSTLEQQLEHEARMQAEAAAGEDFAEGVNAFLEKRAARFTGR